VRFLAGLTVLCFSLAVLFGTTTGMAVASSKAKDSNKQEKVQASAPQVLTHSVDIKLDCPFIFLPSFHFVPLTSYSTTFSPQSYCSKYLRVVLIHIITPHAP